MAGGFEESNFPRANGSQSPIIRVSEEDGDGPSSSSVNTSTTALYSNHLNDPATNKDARARETHEIKNGNVNEIPKNNSTTQYRPYRSRLNRPCDYCRKRRTRCDMVAPRLCALCSRNGYPCTFNDLPTKKKRGPSISKKATRKSQEPDMSSTSTSSSSNPHPHSNSKMDKTGVAANSSNSLNQQSRPFTAAATDNAASGSTSNIRAGSSSGCSDGGVGNVEGIDDDDMPPLLPDGMDGLALIGLSGDQDPNLLQYYNFNDRENIQFIKSSVRRTSADSSFPVQFLAFTDERSASYKNKAKLQRAKIRKMAEKYEERLLALYFRFVHDLYPIVDKKAFQESYQTNRDDVDPGLLAGMLALSCAWWKYDATLCIEAMPGGLSEALFSECRDAIDRDYKYPTLATVQSLLLLLQKRLSLDETANSFAATVDMARLVAIAHNLGLHLDCTNWSISRNIKLLRRKLWATIYIMEKWTAVNTGRPSLLHWGNSNWGIYTSDNSAESLFVELFKLTVILDDIHRELYSERNHVELYQNEAQTKLRVTQFFARLWKWKEELPQDLRSMKQKRRGDYCKNGTLHLAALTVEVLLQKVRLSPASFKLPEYRHNRQQVAELLQRIIVFTSEITHSHLTAFWYCAARLNFSTIAHFIYYYHITSLTTNEYRDTKELIRKWLWALRTLSQGWEEGTGLATSKLDSIFWTGDSLFSDIVPRPSNLNSMLKSKTVVATAKTFHDMGPHATDVTLQNDLNSSQGIVNNRNESIDSIASLPTWNNADRMDVDPLNGETTFGNNHGSRFKDDNSKELHTDWMTDDIALLHEDIMPQEEQVQQLLNTLVFSPASMSFDNPLPDRYFGFEDLTVVQANSPSQLASQNLARQNSFHLSDPLNGEQLMHSQMEFDYGLKDTNN